MRPLERLHRWRVPGGVALFLCLALLGAGANASVAVMQEARAVAAPAVTSMIDAQSMPGVLDCMPYAVCCIAPAPVTHGFSGECKEAQEPLWHVHAAPIPDVGCWFDTRGSVARTPVRIAFCRWLE